MDKISELSLGSSLLSIIILLGYIGTGIVIIRILIIVINYTKEKFSNNKNQTFQTEENNEKKGF